jgi:hypothetical protein
VTVAVYGIGLDGISTSTTLTGVVGVGAVPRMPASGDDDSSGGPDWARAWIAGPVLGAIALLAIVFGVYLYIRRRRRRLQKQGEAELCGGTAEVNTEGLPGVVEGPRELDVTGLPELAADQRARGVVAEMGANEVAAREMDVDRQHQEMDASPISTERGAEKSDQ